MNDLAAGYRSGASVVADRLELLVEDAKKLNSPILLKLIRAALREARDMEKASVELKRARRVGDG